ncbi:zona pellucida sperm-binding protein 3-like [Rhincodon typus]|uniref:zona pellucida sperm-binding protein 3-like n=1 Tax=Rhincodon typus TaxID=259920 RepID=UPI0020307D5E|nr:zona pellucida sperm-binding protein 3-like [Rhincodon typus]
MFSLWALGLVLMVAVTGQQQSVLHDGIAHSCGNTTLTVYVSTDFFSHFDATAFRLGSCPPSSYSPGGLSFQYGLQDCRAGRLVTDKEVVYWNYLKYEASPVPGRKEPQLNRRLECRYPVEEVPVSLTTFPLTGFLGGDGSLVFTMKIMTDDWTAERPDTLFFLGASINLEASVLATYHQGIHLYIEECIATPTSSLAESPKNYTIINNYGCLIDGKTGNSKYLPRIKESHLRFVVQAFKFHDLEGTDIYIHCKVVVWDPSWNEHQLHKACSFNQQTKRWQLLDDPLQSSKCDCCNTICQPAQTRHKRELKAGVFSLMKVGPVKVNTTPLRSRTSDNQKVILLATPLLVCFLGVLILSLYKWKIQHVH